MHVGDELYSRLRGPGQETTVLATAYSDPANKGSGQDVPAMECVGFIVTVARGAEWAATGKVTQKVHRISRGPTR
jgi:hypothetical protein